MYKVALLACAHVDSDRSKTRGGNRKTDGTESSKKRLTVPAESSLLLSLYLSVRFLYCFGKKFMLLIASSLLLLLSPFSSHTFYCQLTSLFRFTLPLLAKKCNSGRIKTEIF